ncbi:MAG: ABC transporter permease, partial [Gemmatimonadota bacterium]
SMDGIERRKEECRDTRRVSTIDNLVRDLRYALRTLRRSPGFTAVAILTLGLGIGANTAIFTVVNAVLLRPLPYRDPGRLVVAHYASMSTVAPAYFLEWQAGARTFDRLGLAEYWTPNLTGFDRPEELVGLRVSAGIFPMLGVEPLLGRVYSPEEEHFGREHVVVLSYDLWNSRFAADSQVLGRTMALDGIATTIIGVMPRGFRFAPFWATEARLWAPLVLDDRRADWSGASLRVFGRLRPGATVAEAQADLRTVAARTAGRDTEMTRDVLVVPLQEKVVGDVSDALYIMLAAVGFVLLIACANVAHLQLMRAAARERESAVRTALGASRLRLVQQSLVESGILSLVGGAFGVALAYWGVRLLVTLGPPELPRLETVALDGPALGFALTVSVLAGFVFGVAPALTASRVKLHGALKEGSRGAADSRRRRRVRSGLVASEFAMAVVLLIGAGLMLRSFAALVAVDGGFDPRDVLSMTVSLRGTKNLEPLRRQDFFRRLVDRVEGLPGVEAASVINHVPLHGDNWHFPFAVEGRSLGPGGDARKGSAAFLVVRPGYFRTMKIGMVKGRDFTTLDEASAAHLVIVNEFMARHQWPGENPVGRRLTVDDPATRPDWFTVVGVVGNVRQASWAGEEEDQMYFPTMQGSGYPENSQPLVTFLNPEYMTLVIRTTAGPAGLTRAVQVTVHEMDGDAPVSNVLTMEQALGEQVATPRFYMTLLSIFAAVAIALAAVGVYGVISYSVARRTHEIGIRLALGAKRSDAFRLVVRQGMALAALGGAVGLGVALAVTKYLRLLLFGIQPTDPTTFVVVTTLLAVVAFVACSIPARRASRVDPTVALRCE